MHVLLTHPHTTQLWKTILSPNRHISIWCGCHTLARGWTPCNSLSETKITSNCILLHHLHTHQTKLQHLRMGTFSHHESTYPLATLLGVDENSIYHPYRPCQPPILEISPKTEPLYSTLACWPPRIWLCHQTYPWEDQHISQQTIMPTQYWSRWKR